MTNPSPLRMFTRVSVTLFGAGVVVFAALQLTVQPTTQDQVAMAHTVLQRARSERRVASTVSISTTALRDAEEAAARKSLFTAMMLPLIAAENERIRAQRAVVKNATSPAQLRALAATYGLDSENVDRAALLRRIDVIPESLVLAQAAIESAWGTSRFAREGNAFFGERTYDPDSPGIKPKRATGFKVKSFTAPAFSVRSYMRTLNTHQAYRPLRVHRAALRTEGQRPTGVELAAHLGKYSELGKHYIKRIVDTITANRFTEFDAIKLANR